MRVDIYPSSTTALLADIESGLPFREGIFDEVYSKCLFEHLRNPFSALLEMRRVCKPGGRIIIITDNAGYPTHYLPQFSGVHVGGYAKIAHGPKDRHYSVFTAEHMRNFAEAAQVEVVGIDFLSASEGPSVVTRVLSKISVLREMAYPFVKMVAKKAAVDDVAQNIAPGIHRIAPP